MNRIDVMGNLVRDVDIAYTAKQNVVAKFMIAENVYDLYRSNGNLSSIPCGHMESGEKLLQSTLRKAIKSR